MSGFMHDGNGNPLPLLGALYRTIIAPFTGDSANFALGRNLDFTVTIAAPGVFTCAAHGLETGQDVRLRTTGVLPTGLTVDLTYYAIWISKDTFKLATTKALAEATVPTAITTSDTQSGVHTFFAGPIAGSISFDEDVYYKFGDKDVTVSPVAADGFSRAGVPVVVPTLQHTHVALVRRTTSGTAFIMVCHSNG